MTQSHPSPELGEGRMANMMCAEPGTHRRWVVRHFPYGTQRGSAEIPFTRSKRKAALRGLFISHKALLPC
jgi:hypothetical protein